MKPILLSLTILLCVNAVAQYGITDSSSSMYINMSAHEITVTQTTIRSGQKVTYKYILQPGQWRDINKRYSLFDYLPLFTDYITFK